jgi:hypothetical protein
MAKFKNEWDLVDAVKISGNVSEDGQAASTPFRNLQAAVGGGVKQPLALANGVASVSLPIDGGTTPLCVRQIVRGFVHIDPGAKAVLLAQLAGNTILIPLPAADGADHNYVHQIESTIPAGAAYQATFFLLVESPGGDKAPGALLTVDSLDVEFKSATARKP